MPNGKDSLLPPEQVRQQVDEIIERWQSFPCFAALFAALMAANGLSDRQLAHQLNRNSPMKTSSSAICNLRRGELDPPYAFIETLLATNALNLDPRRIQSADGEQPPGDQRIALFTVAGLIEVTPEAVRDWNREVLAGHRRLLESHSARPRPRWGDLITKLLAFHRQGFRQKLADIAACLQPLPKTKTSPVHRLDLLLDNRLVPSEQERVALYRYIGLDDGQIATVEEGIADGEIPLGSFHRNTPFASALHSILDKLANQGVTQRQVGLQSRQVLSSGASPLSESDLSAWRYGKNAPTLAKLRSLAIVLRQFGPEHLADPVRPQEIDHLIASSGFHPEQLNDTTHDIIARIDGQTHIKPLLCSLQSAVDTCFPPEEIHRRGSKLGYLVPSIAVLRFWEQPSSSYPSGEQIRDLLHVHNHLIRQKGFPPLSNEEIGKVVAVAEHDYARWQALSHAEKLAEQRPARSRRLPPSPSFDGIEQGR